MTGRAPPVSVLLPEVHPMNTKVHVNSVVKKTYSWYALVILIILKSETLLVSHGFKNAGWQQITRRSVMPGDSQN